MRKCVIAAVMIAAFATPAFADTFYVVMDMSAKTCSVTSEKPDGKKMHQMAKQTFKSEADAKEVMKGMPECNK